jgi:hypothetical protein
MENVALECVENSLHEGHGLKIGRDAILDNLRPSPFDKLRAGSPGLNHVALAYQDHRPGLSSAVLAGLNS